MGDQGGSRKKGTSTKSATSASYPTDIPDKLMFRIGEVSRIVGVEPYVLRYWETEFPQLAPKKSGSGHRMYRRREVEQLLLIRQLLYERQYTIKGARQYLKELSQRKPSTADLPSPEPQPAIALSVAAASPVAQTAVLDAGAASRSAAPSPVQRSWQTRESVPGAVPGAVTSRSDVTIDGLREELRSILSLLD